MSHVDWGLNEIFNKHQDILERSLYSPVVIKNGLVGEFADIVLDGTPFILRGDKKGFPILELGKKDLHEEK